MESARALKLLRGLRRWSFAYIGLPALLVAVAVGWVVSAIVVSSFATMVAESVNGFIDESYPDRASWAPGSASTGRFATIVRLRRQQGNLIAVRVVTSDGVAIYSSASRNRCSVTRVPQVVPTCSSTSWNPASS